MKLQRRLGVICFGWLTILVSLFWASLAFEDKPSAQAAVNDIESAQHSEGGWRYAPNTPGDTSVGGWQLMGLKSAQMAGLEVNPRTLDNAKASGRKYLTR